MDRASAPETVDSGSNPVQGQTKDYKNWYSQLPCLTLNRKLKSFTKISKLGWRVGRNS